MNPMLVGGLGVALVSIVVSMVMDGNSPGALVGPSSLILVLFGTLGSTLMAYRKENLSVVGGSLKAAMKNDPPDLDEIVNTLGPLGDIARRDGMLALESHVEKIDDPFLQTGMQLIVDGQDNEQIREVLDIEIASVAQRHQVGIGFWQRMGANAPSLGMMGTVIGLINMLGNLSNPEQLGIGMSLALLTTLYGVMFANLLFVPIASRLENLSKAELSARDMALDGLLAIQAGASSRVLVERLESYLPAENRVGHKGRTGTAKAA